MSNGLPPAPPLPDLLTVGDLLASSPAPAMGACSRATRSIAVETCCPYREPPCSLDLGSRGSSSRLLVTRHGGCGHGRRVLEHHHRWSLPCLDLLQGAGSSSPPPKDVGGRRRRRRSPGMPPEPRCRRGLGAPPCTWPHLWRGTKLNRAPRQDP